MLINRNLKKRLSYNSYITEENNNK